MELKYPKYENTKILGWSISRYEIFCKCKRQYFYYYYSRFANFVPSYKIRMLKEMTTVPLEIGNVVHDIIEAFLRRLQKNNSNIDENRFFEFAKQKTQEYFSRKTFLEKYYNYISSINILEAEEKICKCLRNFINSPIYNWIYMKAITNKINWMIEPEGKGETRLNGLKAYCKMDFLFPVENEIHIIDWKTGAKDSYKHYLQLIGYATAASTNFGISINRIFPKIVYLYPEFNELEINITEKEITDFLSKIINQTQEMYSYCEDIQNNIPKSIENFPMSPSYGICNYCNFQELCFPDRCFDNKEKNNKEF